MDDDNKMPLFKFRQRCTRGTNNTRNNQQLYTHDYVYIIEEINKIFAIH